MKKRNGLHGWVVAAGLLGFMPGIAIADTTPTFVDAPCDFPIVDDAVRERLRCGTVSVPRDAAQPSEGTFEVAVVVKRSASPKAGMAPVLWLHGGPGGDQVQYAGRSATDVFPGRDVVAFDMRGGGRTGPALCQGMPDALVQHIRPALRGENPEPALNAALDACFAEVAAAGLKPEHFGTVRNVDDAEAIRAALGIERWAIYAPSYGTTVAAEYIARHPSVIESAVLDSLYPPDAFVHSVREAQGRAIGRLLDECARDSVCAARFPGLDRAAADAAIAALESDPLPFHLDGQRYLADERMLRFALHGLFYDETSARTLPWFLDAVVRRDGEALATALGLPVMLADTSVTPDTGVAYLGLLATECRDRPRHHAPHQGPGPNWMTMFIGIPNGVCRAFPLGTAPRLPIGTTAPILILSAGYDGFQPDGDAVAAAIGPAAHAITIPYSAHGVRGAGECPRRLIADFIGDPSTLPDTACVNAMTAPPFLLDVRPMPRVIAAGIATQAGQPPAAVVGGLGGIALLVLAGVVAPVLRGLWRRLRRQPVSGPRTGGIRSLAIGGGLVGITGAVVAVAGTFQFAPGAVGHGLDPAFALALWTVPLGGLVAVIGLARALASRQWLIAIAALGSAVACAALLAIGLTPWG